MKNDIWSYAVHPAADVFPMLSSEDLNELAEDIRANGLVHPLVVKDGVLIDGRNRREACKIAGITPTVVELNGHDPVAYILSSNVNRRHMTKGQRAMGGVYLSQARTVLKWAQEMAAQTCAPCVATATTTRIAVCGAVAYQAHERH